MKEKAAGLAQGVHDSVHLMGRWNESDFGFVMICPWRQIWRILKGTKVANSTSCLIMLRSSAGSWGKPQRLSKASQIPSRFSLSLAAWKWLKYGGFLKWGYHQLSSIYRWIFHDFPLDHPSLGYPMTMDTSKYLEILVDGSKVTDVRDLGLAHAWHWENVLLEAAMAQGSLAERRLNLNKPLRVERKKMSDSHWLTTCF